MRMLFTTWPALRPPAADAAADPGRAARRARRRRLHRRHLHAAGRTSGSAGAHDRAPPRPRTTPRWPTRTGSSARLPEMEQQLAAARLAVRRQRGPPRPRPGAADRRVATGSGGPRGDRTRRCGGRGSRRCAARDARLRTDAARSRAGSPTASARCCRGRAARSDSGGTSRQPYLDICPPRCSRPTCRGSSPPAAPVSGRAEPGETSAGRVRVLPDRPLVYLTLGTITNQHPRGVPRRPSRPAATGG